MIRRQLLALAATAALAGCDAPGRRATAALSPDNGKRGVGTWYFDGVNQALAQIDISWYYTWSEHPGRIVAPDRTEFVPMIWGADAARSPDVGGPGAAGKALLGFNEPDIHEQANLTVDQALEIWPRLLATGRRLGSPAVSAGAQAPGGWLDRFLSGAAARGYRVDFVALHWYGTNPATAIKELVSYLAAVHERYRLPIWLTEFALADFTGGVAAARYAPRTDQAAFAAAAIPVLEHLSYLERYAWFALCDRDSVYHTGLYDARGRLTSVGAAYRSAPAR